MTQKAVIASLKNYRTEESDENSLRSNENENFPDILKHTNKNNPDHSALELSISSIKEVMTYINEDKRKTEGQLVMFDIFNDIDNCPAHLVSSHRSFIGKCEVMELGEGLSGRGDHLVLFLFTDTLEICKKRSKAFNSLKSPKEANGLHPSKLSQGKPYKHIRMLSLSTIKKVVDIRETDGLCIIINFLGFNYFFFFFSLSKN